MHCPSCNTYFENGRFCPNCGTPLVEDSTAKGILGDANAISGGVHLSDSHNVSSVDQRVISTSNTYNITHERQKTQVEIFQERKIQFMEICKQVYNDGILEDQEKVLLERKRIELELDESTAKQLIESARKSANSRMAVLSVKDAMTMKIIKQLILTNDVCKIKAQLPRLEALASVYQVDEVLYCYNLLLAALYPDRLIRLYEEQPTDEYWQTFWVCIAYLKEGNLSKSEMASARLNLYGQYSENNDLLLQAVSVNHDFGPDSVKEVLSILDESSCSPELKYFLYALYLAIDPEKALEVKVNQSECAFYLENIISLESPQAKAEREAKEKAEAEAKARAEAEAAERSKTEHEEILRKQIVYHLKITAVNNQMLAMMTARASLGWSSSDSRSHFQQLPFTVTSSENKQEIDNLKEKLTKGGMSVFVQAFNGLGEEVNPDVDCGIILEGSFGNKNAQMTEEKDPKRINAENEAEAILKQRRILQSLHGWSYSLELEVEGFIETGQRPQNSHQLNVAVIENQLHNLEEGKIEGFQLLPPDSSEIIRLTYDFLTSFQILYISRDKNICCYMNFTKKEAKDILYNHFLIGKLPDFEEWYTIDDED